MTSTISLSFRLDKFELNQNERLLGNDTVLKITKGLMDVYSGDMALLCNAESVLFVRIEEVIALNSDWDWSKQCF